jgi:two-component system response regulator RegA
MTSTSHPGDGPLECIDGKGRVNGLIAKGKTSMNIERACDSNIGAGAAPCVGVVASRRYVVIADDDRSFVEGVASQLEARGWPVLRNPSSATFLSQVGALKPEWLILEPNLPGICWYKLLHSVRQVSSGTKVAVATAYPSSAMSRVCDALKIAEFFCKPVAHDIIAESIGTNLVTSPDAKASERARAQKAIERPAASLFICSAAANDPGNWPSLARAEWEYVNAVLAKCEGNISTAAKLLNIPRQTLYRKLRKHPVTR